jgi:RNA polymerase sigma-32 factor
MMRRAFTEAGGEDLGQYYADIRKQPILEAEEEGALARAWRDRRDEEAHGRLVKSHLRLVASIARSYRGYGIPVGDLVSEGNIGLLQAIEGFDPDRGVRLSTYATFWVRATVQEYILRTWSIVRIATNSSHKKLFFNLRRMRALINAMEGAALAPDEIGEIARTLGVTEADVVRMDGRLSGGDKSLNERPAGMEAGEMQDFLVDESEDVEAALAARQEALQRRERLSEALALLKERERDILLQRRLAEKPTRLEDLSRLYGISRERVRQIEVGAVEKLRRLMTGGPQGQAASA